MQRNLRNHPSLATTLIALLAALLTLSGLATDPAAAAKAPIGRTYFTVFVGLDEGYGITASCFEFGEDDFCSQGGQQCGFWQRTDRTGRQSGFEFDLSFLEDGEAVEVDGQGRVDTRGRGSSIAGVGRFSAGRTRGNFAFAGRQARAARCLELLQEFEGDDGGEVIVGSGNLVTESRSVQGFSGVAASGAGLVTIEHTGTESLTITADDNILPHLTSEVAGDLLLLGIEDDVQISTDDPPLYEVTVRELDEILVAGAIGVEASGIDAARFDVAAAGASAVTAAGRADHQFVSLAGACAYQAEGLESRIATVALDGASVAVVRVSERLEGTVTGPSVLEYYGNPVVDVTWSFPAVVRRAGD